MSTYLHLLAFCVLISSGVQAAPVRQARMRVYIDKQTFSYADHRGYYRSEALCDGEVEIDVYDTRHGGGVEQVPAKSVSCNSTIDGQEVRVEVNGMIVLIPPAANQQEASKTAYLSLNIWQSEYLPIQGLGAALGIGTSIDNRRFSTSLSPTVDIECDNRECHTNTKEFFSARVEINDNAVSAAGQ
jgi:hypothetical protein